ncbi:shikimate dehydrogenase [Tranquillimonas rosea]|uniref:Shikimate dehydrogenase (NADP(+)) n=1 Tax=Tranquillimonas rosea TaxID=641238 RepID=A0A1H9SR25_9RHOB|nr:shikimate dehydrogenase [Tranquillimonas rosea]SER87265.1 shikimate dehydrogenase [Tranquillimonas rosea]
MSPVTAEETGAGRPLRLGLIGRGITLSRTPRMHEAEAAAQGLACRYDLLDMDAGVEGSLSEIVDRAEAEGYAGLNVTFPYKQEIIPLLDGLSDAARRVEAVNTVVFHEGRRSGHNTDFWGFSENLRRNLPDADIGTVLLIGAGGAGGAVGHALADLGAGRILIFDRRDGAAEALAQAVNAAAGRPVAGAAEALPAAAAEARGIVNATPVGMAKMPGTPIDTALLTPDQWVADIVYFPLETEFLCKAKAVGCRTLSGEGMAIFQAVRAFELFTGIRPAAERMRQAFHAQAPDEGAA